MTNTLFAPEGIEYIFDNLDYSKDRYTIQLYIEGTPYIVATNGIASIWSVGESEWISYDDVMDKDTETENIGDEIEWSDLPEELRNHILNYFELKEEE